MIRVLTLAGLLLLAGCKEKETQAETEVTSAQETLETKNTAPELTEEQQLMALNDEVMALFSQKNYQALTTFIHPEKGVTFPMYARVDLKTDKNFSRAEFQKYIGTPIKFTWGEKDGSGEKLISSMQNYFKQWHFTKDLSHAEKTVNKIKGEGNTLINLQEVYPEAKLISNYLPGTEAYAEMDWKEVILLFEKADGKYYLVCVANNVWTI